MKHLGVSISRKLLPFSGLDVQGDRVWQWSLEKGLGFLKKACSVGVKPTIFFFFSGRWRWTEINIHAFHPSFKSADAFHLLNPRKTKGRELGWWQSVEVSFLGHRAGNKEWKWMDWWFWVTNSSNLPETFWLWHSESCNLGKPSILSKLKWLITLEEMMCKEKITHQPLSVEMPVGPST